MSMIINKNGLTARTYRGARKIWSQFVHGESWRTYMQLHAGDTTNLCALFWTVCVGAPLALAANLVVLTWAAFVVAYLLYGIYSAFFNLTALQIGSTVAGAVAIAVVSGYSAIRVLKRAKQSEVGRVVAEYYHAEKSKVCPIIIMEDMS